MDGAALALQLLLGRRVERSGDDRIVGEISSPLEDAHGTQLQLQRPAVLFLLCCVVVFVRSSFPKPAAIIAHRQSVLLLQELPTHTHISQAAGGIYRCHLYTFYARISIIFMFFKGFVGCMYKLTAE